MEIWKPIPGYENYYAVSNYGRIKSLKRSVAKSNGVVQHRKERIKHQTTDACGYLVVGLCVDGVNKKMHVHTLVAKAFVKGWFEGAEINHKDFNRQNNNADNLEWVSHKDNIYYTIRAGRHVCNRDVSGANNPNYGNHVLKKKYSSNKELAKEKQSRPGAFNGMATAVAIINNDEVVHRFSYLGECAKYLIDNGITRGKSVVNVSAKISDSAKNGKPYFGLYFKLI